MKENGKMRKEILKIKSMRIYEKNIIEIEAFFIGL